MKHRIGTLRVDVDFVLTQPWTILFGPSGCGKTTILRAIAGLVRPDVGRIVATSRRGAGGKITQVMVDTAAGCFVPAYKRGIALASQTPSLFPHLSVRKNVEYGMVSFVENAGSEGNVLATASAAMKLLHIGALGGKVSSALSGGEAQRVNLARAMSAARGFLLLDEPFTGLDSALRSKLVGDVRTWAAERDLCVLSVTHDVAEAFQLGAEVIKIADGRVAAQGAVGAGAGGGAGAVAHAAGCGWGGWVRTATNCEQRTAANRQG